VTAEYTQFLGEGEYPGEDPYYPSAGGGELADATSWNESRWSDWFYNNPADSRNTMIVAEFVSINSMWIEKNNWWYPLYSAWVGTGGSGAR
jgi:hypothetical protein